MAKIIPFQVLKWAKQGQPPRPKGTRRLPKVLFFDRQEFSSLLALYSTHVAKGAWRDYAVDFLPGQALFSAYRHAHEAPVLSVAKQVQPSGKGREYVLYAGARRLARADTLAGLTSHINAAAERA